MQSANTTALSSLPSLLSTTRTEIFTLSKDTIGSQGSRVAALDFLHGLIDPAARAKERVFGSNGL